MNKLLRYSLVAIMAVLGMSNAMAEDVIWSEDFSSYEAGGVPSGGTYNYTCVDGGTVTKIYNEALAGGTAPELLVSKKKDDAIGSFTAKISLGSKSGDMTLSFKCNKNITVEVTGGTLGSNTGSGNDYVYPITGASGTLTIVFKNTLSSNARLDNIKLSQGEGVTLGADDNVFPTLTNENGLTITYDSSDKTCATIDATGAITLVAAGKTDISAAFDGNDEYEAAKVTYTLTVKAAPVKVTVAEALKIIADLEDGKTTSDDYIVSGFIVTDPAFGRKTDETLYGNVDFQMADTKDATENLLTVYRAKNIGNKDFTEETTGDIKKGYGISIQGQLQKYVKDEVTTPEIKNCYLVSITVPPVDVNISPASGDISAALDAALGGAKANNVNIKLAKDVTYTITKPIVAGGNIVIEGQATTKIDASGLTDGAFIQLDGSTEFAKKADASDSDHYLIATVKISGVIINGLTSSLIKDAQKTLVQNVEVFDSRIEIPAGKVVFDFNGKGYVGKLKVDHATIWSKGNTGFFAQYGSRPKNLDAAWTQEFEITNATFVNIATGKNICDLKQNGTPQNVYVIKNSLFVDCGKSGGQVVVGFNKGQASNQPIWDVQENAFNETVDGVLTDNSDKEVAKAGQKEDADIVQNSVKGVVAFTDAANGNFNGSFTGDPEPTNFLGDPYWDLNFIVTAIENVTAKAADIAAPIFNMAGQRVNNSYKGVVIQNGKKFMNK